MFRKLSITVLALGLSVVLGLSAGANLFSHNHSHKDESAARVVTKSLEEEMYFVDLIVRGTVVEQQESFVRNAGLPEKVNFNYDVTPSIIKIEEVVYGELDEATITFLQHGTAKTHEGTQYLEPNEEVVLMLVKTEDNYYWSYAYEDGIWRVKDGKVESKHNNVNGFMDADSAVSKLQHQDVDVFVNRIREAALNKKRPEF